MRRTFILATVLLIVILLGCCMSGCFGSAPEYFGDAYPLLYGIEGSESALLVINESGLYGYADSNGAVVIKPQFLYARPFHEGLAAVRNKNGKYGFIETKGKIVIPFGFYGATDFHNGKALVSDRLKNIGELNMEMVSIINRRGIIEKELEYVRAGDYSEGITVVSTYDYKNYMLDENYNLIETPLSGAEEVAPKGFSDGLAIYRLPDGKKFSFLDKAGNRAVDVAVADACPFTEGLAPVKITDEGMWGYIDKSGQWVIDPAYQIAGNFHDGLAVVLSKDEWIVIDTSGKETAVVQCNIDTAMYFQEGLCPIGRLKEQQESFGRISLDYDWGFIDTTGKPVIFFKYDMVTPFKNGIAQVLVDGRIGYIDKMGKYIWEPK